jgi:hypothetical protein
LQFTLDHTLISERWLPERHDTGQGTYFNLSVQGSFLVLHPGWLQKNVKASVRHRTLIETPSTEPPPPVIDGGPTHPHPMPPPATQPLHNGVVLNEEGMTWQFHIYDPDGNAHLWEYATATYAMHSELCRESPCRIASIPRRPLSGIWNISYGHEFARN